MISSWSTHLLKVYLIVSPLWLQCYQEYIHQWETTSRYMLICTMVTMVIKEANSAIYGEDTCAPVQTLAHVHTSVVQTFLKYLYKKGMLLVGSLLVRGVWDAGMWVPLQNHPFCLSRWWHSNSYYIVMTPSIKWTYGFTFGSCWKTGTS